MYALYCTEFKKPEYEVRKSGHTPVNINYLMADIANNKTL